MKRLLKLELSRSFKNGGFLFALIVGIIIAFLQLITSALPYALGLDFTMSYGYPMTHPGWLYSLWLGGDPASMFSYLYFLILPIIAVLPYGDSFFTDAKGGFIQNLCIRTDRKCYYKAKYLAAFLSGGTAVVLPLILNFVGCAMLFPSMKPEVTSMTSAIREVSSFPELYYNHPFLYVLLFLAIIFIFSGLLADFGLVSSYIAGYRFLVLLAPLILYLFLMAGFNLIGIDSWQPINFLRPSYDENAVIPTILETVILFLITAFGFMYRGGKGDIY